MRIIPKPLAEMLDFFRNRVDAWGQDPAAIGLTEPTALAVALAVADMADARREAELARDRAEAASQTYRLAAARLRRVGAGAAQQIRGFAQSRPTPGERSAVYKLALLPEPRQAGPGPEPGTPTRFKPGLLQDGSITLEWDCDNGGGTHVAYEVRRAVEEQIEADRFEHLATVGQRRIVDGTLAAGTARVAYQVRAIRKGRGRRVDLVRGDAARFGVLLGVLREERERVETAKADAKADAA
ncbi:MAG: hypothetical protein NCW75_10630 [Phycisphaera sp.]|nr:MAG: hypothetical protein NCW75_10630 [Phycisphaera sp.]